MFSILRFLLVPWFLMGLATSALGQEKTHVLLLNSYHYGLNWTDDETKGVREILDKSERAIELHVEYMDTKRLADETHFRNLRQLLEYKYRSTKFAAIIVTDNDAFNFLRQYRNDPIFVGVPVIFTGVNFFRQELLAGYSGFTGVAETFEAGQTVGLMQRLHPGVKRIVVIIDATTTGEAIRKEMEPMLVPYIEQFKFEYWNLLSLNQLRTRLPTLDKDTLVLLMPYARDNLGTFISYPDLAAMVSGLSSVPVYGTYDFYMGYGIVGGRLTSGEAQGVAAANILIRVLGGQDPDQIPVTRVAPSEFKFDSRQLHRYGISTNELPQGSRILYQTWYELYQSWLLLAGLLVAVTLLLGWGWVRASKNRRRSDKALRRSKKQLEAILNATTESIFHIDENGIILAINDIAAHRIRREPQDMLGKNSFDFFPPEVAAKRRENLAVVFRTGKEMHTEDTRNDHVFSLNYYPIVNEVGKTDSVVVYAADITERHNYQLQMERLLTEQRALLENDLVGIVTVRDRKIIWANPAFEKMLGYDPGELTGTSTRNYYPSEAAYQEFGTAAYPVLLSGKIYRAQIEHMRKDGSHIWVDLSGVILDRKTGESLWGFIDITERKSLEEAILHERDFAESLIETAQAIVLVLDPEGRIVRFNHYMEELSGYRLEEVKGSSWFGTFLLDVGQEEMLKLFKMALTETRTLGNVNPILAKDGRKILVEWYDKTLKDSAGNVLGLLAIGQDVTQREQLAESQRLLKAAVEQSNSSIVVTDVEGKIIFVNAGFTHTTGYSLEEVVGQNPRILKSGKIPDETYSELWATVASGRSWAGELCNKKKSGELYWETANISPIISPDGRITHYLAVKDDITLRKQAETALQEQKNFLSTILESEPECVKVLNNDGMLLQMNAAGLSMLEVSGIDEVNECGLIDFVIPDHRAAFLDLSRRVFKGETGIVEFQIVGKHGSRRWLETHATPLRDSSGSVMHLLAVTRDVTRRKEAEERLALSLRGADMAMTDWHIPSDTVTLGEGWINILGYQPGELGAQSSTLAALIRREDALPARDSMIRHLKGQSPYFEAEVRMCHKDGHWVWVMARGMAVERSADGRAVRVSGTAMDISSRKQAEAEIARLSQWNELLLNSAGEGIYGVNHEGICTFINPAALAILGFAREEVLGKNQHVVFHHHHKNGLPYPQEDCPIYQTLHDGIRRGVEDAFIRKNGEIFPVQLTVTPMHENGQIVGVEAVFQDIAQRKEMEQELTRLATTDPLTGVSNRRHFIEQLEMELAHVIRFGKTTAFLMVDIDHFKRVNDTHGHATGDAVLKHFAELTKQRLRRVDLLGRLGGEEFGILLPGTDSAGAVLFAERLRNYVADTPAQSGNGAVSITISIGIAMFTATDASPDSIMARADVALYQAKEYGRNRVEVG